MLNQIYIHYITTLFVLESFIISCWLLKWKKIGIGIGQFARKKSESESASLLEKNRYRNWPRKIMIGASLPNLALSSQRFSFAKMRYEIIVEQINRNINLIIKVT